MLTRRIRLAVTRFLPPTSPAPAQARTTDIEQDRRRRRRGRRQRAPLVHGASLEAPAPPSDLLDRRVLSRPLPVALYRDRPEVLSFLLVPRRPLRRSPSASTSQRLATFTPCVYGARASSVGIAHDRRSRADRRHHHCLPASLLSRITDVFLRSALLLAAIAFMQMFKGSRSIIWSSSSCPCSAGPPSRVSPTCRSLSADERVRDGGRATGLHPRLTPGTSSPTRWPPSSCTQPSRWAPSACRGLPRRYGHQPADVSRLVGR